MNDAIKALRNIAVLSFTAALVWVIASPSAIIEMERKSRARHLVAWMAVNELSRNIPSFDDAEAVGDSFNSFENEVCGGGPQGGCFNQDQPLTLNGGWFGSTEHNATVTLVRTDPDNCNLDDCLKVFKVDGQPSTFPFSDYNLVVMDNNVAVRLDAARAENHRAVLHILHDEKNLPQDWRALKRDLEDAIEKPLQAAPENRADPAVAKFLRQVESRRYKLAGFELDPFGFYLAIGPVLGVFAFLTLGPLIAMRRRMGEPWEHPWVFVSTASGRAAGILEWSLVGLAVVWVLYPILLFGMQFSHVSSLSDWQTAGLIVGALGLGASSWANFAAVTALRRLRIQAPKAGDLPASQ